MIPRKIFQLTTNNIQMNDRIFENIEFLKTINPSWDYELLDESRQVDFLSRFAPGYLSIYSSFGRGYDVAKMDFFRYVLVYECGGVYLDLKSSFVEPLDHLVTPKDTFIVSRWTKDTNSKYANWGLHPELSEKGEYINGVVISEAKNPVLKSVIEAVIDNVNSYSAFRDGVGGPAVLRLTGPIAYTLAIEQSTFRQTITEVDFFRHGYKATVFDDDRSHMSLSRLHYGKRRNPIIRKQIIYDYFVCVVFSVRNVAKLFYEKISRKLKR